MFNKVLVVDDIESINEGVSIFLTKFGIPNVIHVQYCDEAFLKLKRAQIDNEPFDLIITDLSFKRDHRQESLKSGEDLVKAIKKEFPALKIIVYSVENKKNLLKRLVENLNVDSFVCKGRRGVLELQKALEEIHKGKKFHSPEVVTILSSKEDLELSDYDVDLLRMLSLGYTQDDISAYLKEKNISPNSLSTIEKRINKLRIQFKASNAIQLVAISKDMGVI